MQYSSVAEMAKKVADIRAQRAVHDLNLLDAGIISLCVNVHLYY